MGGGSFSSLEYRSYATATTRNFDGSVKTIDQVFTQQCVHEDLDPRKIVIRESCDSEDNPESLPIIIGLDVTGSMGYLAHAMVDNQLGILMEGIIDEPSIKYPHMMFMAIGDASCDITPLQASQFEADIRIAQQLSNIYVEGHGGGNDSESYDLPWYFAATRTKIDSFDKRGKKGYIFTIGDEMPPIGVTARGLEKTFGPNQDTKDYTAAELLEMAQEKYHVFHLIVEEGSYAKRALDRVVPAWKNMLGRRALCLNDHTKLANVIVAAIRVNEGESPESVIASLQDEDVKASVEHALYNSNEIIDNNSPNEEESSE